MKAAAVLLAAFAAACGTASLDAHERALDDARLADEDAVAAHSEIDAPRYAGQWIVVQRGQVVAAASMPNEAVRAALREGPPPLHRFVFRPAERGPRLYRLAYVAEGGVVVGRKFLADLGVVAAVSAGRAPVLRKRGGGQGVDLAKPRLAVEIASLDGSTHRAVQAAYDPDFDGGLLLPRDVAAALSLERFEIPGETEVQVALGRPFRARRATVVVRIPAIEVAGAAEAVYEVSPARR